MTLQEIVEKLKQTKELLQELHIDMTYPDYERMKKINFNINEILKNMGY